RRTVPSEHLAARINRVAAVRVFPLTLGTKQSAAVIFRTLECVKSETYRFCPCGSAATESAARLAPWGGPPSPSDWPEPLVIVVIVPAGSTLRIPAETM